MPLNPESLPLRSRADLDIYGRSIDALNAAELLAKRDAQLLSDAQRTLVTQFSRWTLALAGSVVTGAVGGVAGGSFGAAVGYAGAATVAFVTDKVFGIQIPPEVVQFGQQASEAVATASSTASEWIPAFASNTLSSDTADNLTQTAEMIAQLGRNFYSHVAAGLSGISVAGFLAGKTAPYGWAKGDGWGRSLGTKISLPFVKIHDRIKTIPQEISHNIFEA